MLEEFESWSLNMLVVTTILECLRIGKVVVCTYKRNRPLSKRTYHVHRPNALTSLHSSHMAKGILHFCHDQDQVLSFFSSCYIYSTWKWGNVPPLGGHPNSPLIMLECSIHIRISGLNQCGNDTWQNAKATTIISFC